MPASNEEQLRASRDCAGSVDETWLFGRIFEDPVYLVATRYGKTDQITRVTRFNFRSVYNESREVQVSLKVTVHGRRQHEIIVQKVLAGDVKVD